MKFLPNQLTLFDMSSKDVMPKINGKSFRCSCLCNVFRKIANEKYDSINDIRYKCNSCDAIYVGKKC